MREKSKTAAPALVLTVCAAGLMTFSAAETVFAAETPKEDLATKLRIQGFPCGTVESATRDEKHSVPNEAVWVVACDDGVYRMTVVPDLAARIERLKK